MGWSARIFQEKIRWNSPNPRSVEWQAEWIQRIKRGTVLITSIQAFLFAKWALIALLAVYGYAAAALFGSSRFWAIFYALPAGAIGSAVVLAKYYLSGH